ncbi:MAG: Fe-S assembly protein IscX [Anaerolineaceae bacterium]|nr:MAG: Fe-S assembly protein IscX [Anaerolineaceae bacterium]
MGKNSQTTPLYWESTYEIVLALMEVYPQIDLDKVGLGQLCDWVVALPGFADDPRLANDHILTDILREWYEETH